jgi:hypothetical protein
MQASDCCWRLRCLAVAVAALAGARQPTPCLVSLLACSKSQVAAETLPPVPPLPAGLNYFQSVTPQLALGAELFWLQSNLKSGVGLAARHTGEKHIAVAQAATTGILSLQYGHKVTDKVRTATCLCACACGHVWPSCLLAV